MIGYILLMIFCLAAFFKVLGYAYAAIKRIEEQRRQREAAAVAKAKQKFKDITANATNATPPPSVKN